MKKYAFTIAMAMILIIASCKETKKDLQNQNAINNNSLIENGTYLSANNGDTVVLILENTENVISGKLDFLPYEKDSRQGTIVSGQLQGDTLFAIYNSMQEGQQSECEIAFLKNADSFILTNDIYGENNYKYNTAYTKGSFINKNSIKFDGDTLRKISTDK